MINLPGSAEPVANHRLLHSLEPAYSGGSAPEFNGIPLAPEYEKERLKITIRKWLDQVFYLTLWIASAIEKPSPLITAI
jgi:hypothetical protein